MKYLFVLFFVGSIFISCESENEEELFATPMMPKDTMRMDSMDTAGVMQVSFARTILPLVRNNCGIPGCHAPNSVSPTLTDYVQISQRASRIRARAVVQMSMPPSGRPDLTPEQIADLQSWIDNGAPNN